MSNSGGSINQLQTAFNAAITSVMQTLFNAQLELVRGSYHQCVQLVRSALAQHGAMQEAVVFSFSNQPPDYYNQLEQADDIPADISGPYAKQVLQSAVRTLRLEGSFSTGLPRVIDDHRGYATAGQRAVLFAFNDCMILVEPGADATVLRRLYDEHKTAINKIV